MITTQAQVAKAGIECADRADGNLRKWGMQDLLTLIAAAAEELGECAQEVLAEQRSGGRLDRVCDEAVDLGALCIQIVVVAREGMANRGPAGVAYQTDMAAAAATAGRKAGDADGDRELALSVVKACNPKATPVPWFARGKGLELLCKEMAEEARAAADLHRDGSPQTMTAVDRAADKVVEMGQVVYATDPEAVRLAIVGALPSLEANRRCKELARRIRAILGGGERDEEPVGTCPACGAMVPQDERTCPGCGLRETQGQED